MKWMERKNIFMFSVSLFFGANWVVVSRSCVFCVLHYYDFSVLAPMQHIIETGSIKFWWQTWHDVSIETLNGIEYSRSENGAREERKNLKSARERWCHAKRHDSMWIMWAWEFAAFSLREQQKKTHTHTKSMNHILANERKDAFREC